MINIENKTGYPITEHKVDILDWLDPIILIGRGVGHQFLIKNPRYAIIIYLSIISLMPNAWLFLNIIVWRGLTNLMIYPGVINIKE
jgi:hypothetical protein